MDNERDLTHQEHIDDALENVADDLSMDAEASDVALSDVDIDDKADTQPESESDINPPPRLDVFEWAQAMVFSVVLIVMLFVTAVRMIGVDGPSMMETLHDGDRIALSALFYTPKQGDIVVVRKLEFMEEPIVKRVIAVGGQTIDIDFKNGIVYVGETGGELEVLDEPYIKNLTTSNYNMVFPIDVPEGHVFIMGDNRLNSKDSRHPALGVVDNRNIIGRVIFRVYPFTDFGFVK